PKAYRFRILNAADDRFLNLQLYVANSSDYTTADGFPTEVSMVPAVPTPSFPAQWPTDGRAGGVPDPNTRGPDLIQIGTEGGFLPAPVQLPTLPVNWNVDPTTFGAGNVNQGTLILGCAERADVIVDFSKFPGQTLILYNDAPAAFPALDPRYDYYTYHPDLTDTGGTPPTYPGYGPNTRTIMQIRVKPTVTPGKETPDVTLANLVAVFEKTLTKNGVFEVSQDDVISTQAAYNSAYNDNFPDDNFVRIGDSSYTFRTLTGAMVTLPLQPKAIQDEMGEAFDEYGRMSGFLGLQYKNPQGQQNLLLYGYESPPVDILTDSDITTTQIGELGDGTQIWKITHNGVDTHPVHWHLFNVQVINRVAWDNAIRPPDPNELGWKETLRVNPLEDTIVAMRPYAPILPFDLPNSIRPIAPTEPLGVPLKGAPGGQLQFFDPTGQPVQVVNHLVNYGWEYVFHCHILAHEEMDMMHAMLFGVSPKAPTNLSVISAGSGNNVRAVLTWMDNSVSETNYIVNRSLSMAGPWTTIATIPSTVTGPTKGQMTYSDATIDRRLSYYYQVIASNVVGDTAVYPAPAVGFPKKALNTGSNLALFGTAAVTSPAAPTNLTATLQNGPQIGLTWRDNAVNETGFVIERTVDGGVFTVLTTVSSRTSTGSVSYTDTAVAPAHTYQYRVAAINPVGKSAYSNIVNVPVPDIPNAPTNLNATAFRAGGPNDRVTLNWLDNSANETGFRIQRATNGGFTVNLVTSTVGVNATSFTTGNVPRSTTFFFRVQSFNNLGQSAWSNTVQVMTP
ncbi:MAG: multicopper oxidase domain-containing protein, partial [Methanoregula sp.]|nr:multicopper oxidase domain-containing protein [Methanoregula sp.]